jgi:hypothetical protein
MRRALGRQLPGTISFEEKEEFFADRVNDTPDGVGAVAQRQAGAGCPGAGVERGTPGSIAFIVIPVACPLFEQAPGRTPRSVELNCEIRGGAKGFRLWKEEGRQ